MLFGGSEHDGAAIFVDAFGDLFAVFLGVSEQFAEHRFDIVERVVVRVPQHNVVLWHLAFCPLCLPLLFWRNDGRHATIVGRRRFFEGVERSIVHW